MAGKVVELMREFNYSKSLSLDIPANMYDLISKIYEYKGNRNYM